MDKKKIKILLISPYPDSGLTDMKEPPHGLAYIASNLRDNGFKVEAIDAKQRFMKTHVVITEAVKSKPDLVGITAMTPDITCAAIIAGGIKAALPRVFTVIGGPHVNALPEETLEEFPSFDLAVEGEGEFTMLELANKLEKGNLPSALPEIKGIAYRDVEKIILNPPRDYIHDLDILPPPAWDLFPFSHNKSYPVYATRGCPFACKFCQRVLGNKVRRRNIEKIVREVTWVLDTFKTKGFWFADETFGANRKWTHQLLDHMIEAGIPSRATWHAQTRADLITEDLLTRMKQAGCDGLAFGVESGNQEILKKTNKNIKLEDAERAVSFAKKVGVKTRSFFILGHPYETIETIKDTINFAAKLNTDFISFAVMVPYPGTEVWRLASMKEAGYNYVSRNWDDYRKHLAAPLGFSSIPAETLRNLDRNAYLIFYWRNRRWFDLFDFLWGHRSMIKAYIFNKIKEKLYRFLSIFTSCPVK
ncbi:Fe-S oxidoreductase [Candidatus Scalindua japonica]|uniref:Fe-S oxidoreductase n=1 Tax=Candidatus Scalindua japonica TaxID=1284222 RepID=A0A286TTL4_9BACT|nr:radical SAM protein [Candidatus Scalindua japonica]GAX59203.1 Fe-S oxidoreductase [Candidatus Scalindua japonica]